MRSLRKAARKVAVLPFALRDLVDEALIPLAPSRAGGVMLVFVQVSSMKTSRLGSMSPSIGSPSFALVATYGPGDPARVRQGVFF